MNTIYNLKEFKFSTRSLKILGTIDIDLQRIILKALTLQKNDLSVSEGLRTIETQIEYVKRKASKTYNSRHLHGYACDLYVLDEDNNKAMLSGKNIIPFYSELWENMKQASNEIFGKNVLRWGGDFDENEKVDGTFLDLCHYELHKNFYPDKEDVLKDLRKRGLIK